MRRSQSRSVLHLQLGQEVIYLLLAIFAVASLILALFLVMNVRKQKEQSHHQNKSFAELVERIGALTRENEVLKRTITSSTGAKPLVDDLTKQVQRQSQDLSRMETQLVQSRADNVKLQQDLRLAQIELARLQRLISDKPPIINLKETEGYSFPIGESSLTPAFRDKIQREAVPFLLESARTYQANVIEVIGHTDELPIRGQSSNLDAQLLPFLKTPRDGRATPRLDAADNAGLGMARAAAVAKFLMDDGRLQGMRILPLSGAQVVDVNDALSLGGDPRDASGRRRIEVRARRAN